MYTVIGKKSRILIIIFLDRTVTDYEDPWDQNKDATLLYNLKRHGSGYSEGSDNSFQQNKINLDGKKFFY